MGSAAEDHGPTTYPQFLHHRTHRPRQVHPGRPAASAHRDDRRPGHDGASAGHHGPGAGKGCNDQGIGGADELSGGRRADLRTEPGRHAGPCGLCVRGQPRLARVRGRGAGRRRVPGGGGADAGEPLPGHGGRSGGDPGHQQDRSGLRPARRGRRGDRGDPGHARRGCAAHLGQGRHQRQGAARRGGEACAAASRPARPAVARPDIRQPLRCV